MLSRRIFVLSLCFLVGVSCLNAQEKGVQEKAKDILNTALDKLEKGTYQTKTISNKESKSSVTISQQRNPDGTIFNRYEAISKDGMVLYLRIVNNSGVYNIVGNTAIKINYKDRRAKIEGVDEYITYSLENDSINGFPYYVITKKTLANEVAFQAYVKSFPDALMAGRNNSEMRTAFFDKMFPCVEKYWISKQNAFIRSCSYYNRQGKLIQTVDYGNVDLNPSFKPGYFEIPGSLEVKVVNTHKEYAREASELMGKEIDKNIPQHQPAAKKQDVNYLDKFEHNYNRLANDSDATTILSRILFWVSMACVATVIGFKVRQKIIQKKTVTKTKKR